MNGNALTRKFKADILHSRLLLQKDAMRWVVSPHTARALNTFCGNFDISQVSAAIFKSKCWVFLCRVSQQNSGLGSKQFQVQYKVLHDGSEGNNRLTSPLFALDEDDEPEVREAPSAASFSNPNSTAASLFPRCLGGDDARVFFCLHDKVTSQTVVSDIKKNKKKQP